MDDAEFLLIWVIGHGDQAEMISFEMSIVFFLDGKPKISMKDYVRGLPDHYRGQPMMINEYHVTQYFDVESKEIKDPKAMLISEITDMQKTLKDLMDKVGRVHGDVRRLESENEVKVFWFRFEKNTKKIF